MEPWHAVRLYTLGHSTRPLDEALEMLRAFGIRTLADVRTIPRSRHNPQYNASALGEALARRGIRYLHLPRLGGLRKARKDSPNTGWHNASFQGFADYMLTEEFEAGLAELRAAARDGPVALLCAEAVPFRCHRSLIADVLTARGAQVEHIASARRSSPHRMTTFAQVHEGRVLYPGENAASEPLPCRAPFHLEATVRILQRRPANLVDVWAEGRYRRVLPTAAGLALIEVANSGTVDEPDVRLRVRPAPLPAPARRELAAAARRLLGLDVDPAPLQARAESVPRLAPIARALRGMRPPRFASLFETFANVIPFQQVSLDSGAAVVKRLVERFGEPFEHEGGRQYAFPQAAVVAAARTSSLQACGLSLRKAEVLRRLARATARGEVTEEHLETLSSEDAQRFLMELDGIGPWSAALVLLRGLGRLDVFPPGDVGFARGIQSLLGVTSTRALERTVERFGDRTGYLYYCTLGASLFARGLIQPAPARKSRKARPRADAGGPGAAKASEPLEITPLSAE